MNNKQANREFICFVILGYIGLVLIALGKNNTLPRTLVVALVVNICVVLGVWGLGKLIEGIKDENFS